MLLVLIHELGHFICAKKSGVKVLEFGIGIPPKVCKLRTDKSGTEYTLNLIPLWWFVRLKGEDPAEEEDFKAKDSFIKAKMWKKIIILLAGVSANIVFARVLFTIVFTLWTRPILISSENSPQAKSESYLLPTKTFLYAHGYLDEASKKKMEKLPVIISDIESWSLAMNMKIKTWDTIKTMNGIATNLWNIDTILKDHQGTALNITVLRAGKIIPLKWACLSGSCEMGIAYDFDTSILDVFSQKTIKFPLGQAMLISLHEIKAQTQITFRALGVLGKSLASLQWSKISKELNKMTWPVGAVKIGNMLYEAGWRQLFLAFAGMISLALALFNVLPIPALDGGRLLGVLIQWIGKLKPEKYFVIEWYINLIFFILLMTFGVYIIFRDLVRFRGVHIPFIS